MRLFGISALLVILVGGLSAQPVITPTNFLNTDEPVRMCQDYIDAEFGTGVMAFTQPSGGAAARIDMGGGITRCLYIFCDEGLDRLLVFSLNDDGVTRKPRGIKSYGLLTTPQYFQVPTDEYGEPDSIITPYFGCDSIECFHAPIDVAVSSPGRFFEPASDNIYVLDQANQRIVKLRYDLSLDSLVWVSSFGPDILDMPTAIDYADYGDQDPDNDDIFVTDGLHVKIFRFSRDGNLETSYGGWGMTFGSIGYPTGIAVSTADSFANRFYITDSWNHRVMRYFSNTSGPIMAEQRFTFPLEGPVYIKAVDTDDAGNVYVLDNFTHTISVLPADLDEILLTYGGYGHDPGLFDYPYDLYIDDGEMQVCEVWGPESGIQSFTIQSGQPKREAQELPKRFYLYQNYPNPFNSSTTIRFDIPRPGDVRLVIYNVLGQRVAVPVDRALPAGSHSIIWDGKNISGDRVATGIYFYLLTADEHHQSRKLLLLK